eukprot:TRINITY_DN27656_c0_g1_i1.p1 TRINITY_DN27656_c0_g1~~TRINITY_DN27656_c0_g1_i1.p1  ORF type:complete len:701 (-),score=71.67 TRINITY_DN27656_c0_g1_i1:43-2106(-)
MKTFLLVFVALMIPACRSQTKEDVEFMEGQPVGCFQQGYIYSHYIENTNINTTSVRLCQEQCQKVSGCVKFAYFAWRGECWFADSSAVMTPTTSSFVFTAFRTCTPDDLIIPARCRTETPSADFPNASAAGSNSAWPGGQQPVPGECWPKLWDGQLLACNRIEVLDDTRDGWPGKCRGLVELKSVKGTDCEENCRSNPFCQSYQNTVYNSCWQGMGYDCFARNNFVPTEAKRFQRGQVRVLMDIKGWHIVGLYKVFDNSEGMFTKLEDAVTFCRHICYSDVRCEYWSYAPAFGCWVEDASQEYRPAYPLTLTSALRDTDFARNSVAGEYIQHFCDPQMVSADIPQTSINLTHCAERAYRYDPPDMALQGRTIVSDYEACRERCKRTLYCAFFAFWPDGGCHITDPFAKKVLAENWYVISGPADCSKAYGTASAHPEDWLNNPKVVPSKLSEKGEVLTAEIAFTVHNLDLSQLWAEQKLNLRSKYAKVIATTLGCASDMVRDTNGTDARKGLVKLTSGATTGRRLFSSVSETLVTAYTPNQPPNSDDNAALLAKLKTKEFVESVKAATATVVHSTSPAITGDGLAISEPEVGTSKYPLPAFNKESSGDGLWWPLIAVAAVFCCCCTACCIQYTSELCWHRPRRMYKYSDRDSSDDELMSRSKKHWTQTTPGPQQSYQGYKPQPGTFAA